METLEIEENTADGSCKWQFVATVNEGDMGTVVGVGGNTMRWLMKRKMGGMDDSLSQKKEGRVVLTKRSGFTLAKEAGAGGVDAQRCRKKWLWLTRRIDGQEKRRNGYGQMWLRKMREEVAG